MQIAISNCEKLRKQMTNNLDSAVSGERRKRTFRALNLLFYFHEIPTQDDQSPVYSVITTAPLITLRICVQ